MTEQIVCEVCEKPIENIETAHEQHEFGCPALEFRDRLLCTCNKRFTHPECCPDCNNPERALDKVILRAILGDAAIKEIVRRRSSKWN